MKNRIAIFSQKPSIEIHFEHVLPTICNFFLGLESPQIETEILKVSL